MPNRGIEVVERLRCAGYSPQIRYGKVIVRKGAGERDKREYAKWIDQLNDAGIMSEAVEYIKATPRPRRRDWRRHKPALLKQCNHICFVCKGEIHEDDETEIDHIVPLSREGQDVFHNLRIVHKDCNRAKGVMMPDDEGMLDLQQ